MRILHTADWHLDLANLDYTVPAVEALIEKAHEIHPDLVVHAGDIAVHRGAIHPHVARKLRVLLTQLAETATFGMLLIEGNHDQVYTAGRDGAALGILAGKDSGQSADGKIRIVTRPEIVGFEGPSGTRFVCIPSPNRYWLDAAKANGGDESDVTGLLASIVRGLVAEAGPGCIGVYHGSIAGGMAGDEFTMKAGMEGVLPASAWDGCGPVLCGHLHHGQRLSGRFYYPGSIAPLTWNDRLLQPAAFLHDTRAETVEAIPLPVVSQMLQATVDLVADDQAVPVNEQLEASIRSCWSAVAGDRIRLHVRAAGAVLDGFNSAAMEVELAAATGARSVTLVTERTDESRVRFDVDAGWGVIDALHRYLDLKGIKPEDRAPLLAIAEEIERSVEDAHLDARYEFRPLTLALANWCQYETAAIDFDGLGQVVAITGANYAGKSNLMRAILFALYKHQVSGNLLSDLIRKGQEAATVGLTFESGGQTYSIARQLRRGSDGRKCTASLALLRMQNGEWAPVNEGKANETQAAIERLVGPLHLFLATSFAGQNDVDSLLDLTPAELKDVLLSVLQRDFEGRAKMLRSRMAEAEKLIEKARAEHGVHAAQAAAAVDLEARLERLNEEIQTWQGRVSGSARPEDLDQDLAAAMQRVAEFDAARAERARLQAEADKLATRAVELQQREAALLRLADGQADLGAKLEELRAVAGEADAIAEQLREARAGYDAALQDQQRVGREIAVAVAEAADAAREARVVYNDAKARHDALKTTLDRAQVDATLLEKVPCEGRDIEVGYETIECSACPLLKQAVAASESLPNLRDQVAAAERVRRQLLAALADADATHKEIAGAGAINQEAAAVAVATTKKLVDKLDLKERAWRQTERARSQIEAKIAENRAALEALPSVRGDLKVARERMDSLATQLGAAGGGEQEARDALERVRTEAKKRADIIKAAEAELASYQQMAAAAQERLAVAREASAAAASGELKIAGLETERIRYALVEEAMHRDGIPFLLLEQFAVPQLRGLVNRYLDQTEIRVAVQTERELLGGELRNAVELTFADHRGQHPLSAASGFQRTAIGMALRNAMADLHAAATGSRIWLTVQDEGLGTCDEAHLDGVKTTIRAIAARRGGHFVIASHVGGLAEAADSILAVSDNGNGASKVEAV